MNHKLLPFLWVSTINYCDLQNMLNTVQLYFYILTGNKTLKISSSPIFWKVLTEITPSIQRLHFQENCSSNWIKLITSIKQSLHPKFYGHIFYFWDGAQNALGKNVKCFQSVDKVGWHGHIFSFKAWTLKQRQYWKNNIVLQFL